MRIDLTIHDYDPGYGQGRYCQELVRHLSDRMDFHVHASRFSGPPLNGVTYEPVRAVRRTALTTIPTFLAGVEPRLRGGPHGLVHAQGLSSWTADLITAHVCNAARTFADPGGSLKSRFFHQVIDPLEESFYRRTKARHLIAVSECVATEIRTHYGWSRPVSVIYHGVDSDRFKPVNDPVQRREGRALLDCIDGDVVWLFVGEADKGLAGVIPMLAHFPNARLLVASRSDRTPYLASALQCGVASKIRWLGPVQDTATLYPLADVFVYPSAYDAFGMVVAEAMSCGVPVIAGRDIGSAEWIQDGQNGLLCDPLRSATLFDALRRVSSDSELHRRLSAEGRITARLHSWERCASRTAAIYESLQSGRTAS